MPEPPITGDAVLDLVRKSDVVDIGDLSAYLNRADVVPPPGGPSPTASDTATKLVQAGLLTPFQARLILRGKYKGFRIGPYRILDQIGVGGMGQVFLAEHTVMRRRVAVKILPARLAVNREGVQRFYREARAVAALDHPNIVRAHDVGFDKGTHFLVLEYVQGKTLEALAKQAGGALPWGEAAGFAVQAAAGLEHAHGKAIVHRDVKPANLLVDREGVLKILDMGLARFFDEEHDPLAKNFDPSAVMGTADYVAPEQLLDSVVADHRADIYALGATLYHMATGRVPFEGPTTAKLVGHQMTNPTPAHMISKVPERLSAVIARMMAKKPADRFPNMGEVVAALLPFVTPAKPMSGPISSVKLPPLALAAVSQSTTKLAAALASLHDSRDRVRRKKRLVYVLIGAILMVAGITVTVIVATRSGPEMSHNEPSP